MCLSSQNNIEERPQFQKQMLPKVDLPIESFSSCDMASMIDVMSHEQKFFIGRPRRFKLNFLPRPIQMIQNG